MNLRPLTRQVIVKRKIKFNQNDVKVLEKENGCDKVIYLYVVWGKLLSLKSISKKN